MPSFFSARAQQAFAITGLVYCAAIWGSTFYVVRDLVAAMDDPLLLVGYRFTLAALLLLPLALMRWASPAGRATARRSIQAGLVLGAIDSSVSKQSLGRTLEAQQPDQVRLRVAGARRKAADELPASILQGTRLADCEDSFIVALEQPVQSHDSATAEKAYLVRRGTDMTRR